MQMASAANLPATNSFNQLEIYRAPFPLYVGTVLQGNTENQRQTPETTGKHRETIRWSEGNIEKGVYLQKRL